ncbi:MAG TPA: HD domain-containing protein [Ktedonobacterales bacterium]|jgi:(p)ppGpp synthase/HD superfamily hydrolase|nr:HD domain-containing protein [Ktedonobacterales bacterium]
MPTLEDAILLAVQAHHGQLEKNGQPYILHPLRVMFRLEHEHERMAAVLHDVVEDTPHTLDDLRARGYPPEVVAAVDCLTRRPTETYEEFIERAAVDHIARRVKLADLEDNMDIRRLTSFAANDADRMRKYLIAWRALTGPA